jgi:hypothetical protein
MTYTGGTSNMLNHLKLKHSSDISGWYTPEKQPSVAEFPNSQYIISILDFTVFREGTL